MKSDGSANSGEESLGPLGVAFSDEGPVFFVRSADEGADNSAIIVGMGSLLCYMNNSDRTNNISDVVNFELESIAAVF